MNAKSLRDLAATYGTVALLYIDDGDDALAAEFALQAAHTANLALERERVRDAPALTILRNQHLALARQANTSRCAYRVITEWEDDGEKYQAAGDPCGGKLTLKKRARVVVGVECTQCGRHVAISPPEVAQETTKEEAA